MNIDKDIEMLNEIIESGWLISDLEQCPAIDACEDAIKALKQYGVLQEIRQEIRQEIDSHCSDNRDRNDGLYITMKIIDKHIKEII